MLSVKDIYVFSHILKFILYYKNNIYFLFVLYNSYKTSIQTILAIPKHNHICSLSLTQGRSPRRRAVFGFHEPQ